VTPIATICLALSALYAVVTFANLAIFRVPRRPDTTLPAVSILIPARNEADNIGPAIDAARATEGIDIEIVVLDDGSADGTSDVVRDRAATDPRVRLLEGEGLPAGWNGKQYACWRLAQAAANPLLAFVDADVRLAPDGMSRLAGYLERRKLDLASGFPRQKTETLAEKVTIPQIFVLLLGYLPLPMARIFRAPGFGAGCGQLMLVRKGAYEKAGGHAEIRKTMHDGLMLPRLIRRSGGRTDILNATPLAECRMYAAWPEIWAGFAKNATEGMAKPVALPIWTILLGGGHVLPYLLVPISAVAENPEALRLSLIALGLLLSARLATALVVRQSLISVVAHPVGVLIVLAIQWRALVNAGRGQATTWRGRSYDAG
jgi:hypothetical protein